MYTGKASEQPDMNLIQPDSSGSRKGVSAQQISRVTDPDPHFLKVVSARKKGG